MWYDSTTPILVPAGNKNAAPMTLAADPGTGNVQIQVQNSAGVWTTPAQAEYTITEFSVVDLRRQNMPGLKIIATGDAKFLITGL